jgi:nucleoside permease NupC
MPQTREAAMQGMTLLVTFLAMALVCVAIAAMIGIVLDNFPNIHDMLSVLGFFGTLAILLPVGWVLAVRLTEPREPTRA